MRLLCPAAVLLSMMSVSGWSQTLYSNGGVLGDPTVGGYNISGQSASGVFDTFTISSESDSIVTGVSNIGLWVSSGDTPLSLSWYICVSICVDGDGNPFGVLDSGTDVSLSTNLVDTGVQPQGGPSYDIYAASFSVDNLDLSPGEYTLELYGAVDGDCADCSVLWDVSNGPSAAYETVYGSPTASNSFEVDEGNVEGTTPEPGTFVALGTGLVAISLLRRRGVKKRPGSQ
jgi:hypothetical protein